MRITTDRLTGTRRQRVIVQCKHWQSKSVAVSDLSALTSQMKLLAPPRVDELIIATSGRFTGDAVQWIEMHNQSDQALHISMWPDSHLELVLASRRELIEQFRLE